MSAIFPSFCGVPGCFCPKASLKKEKFLPYAAVEQVIPNLEQLHRFIYPNRWLNQRYIKSIDRSSIRGQLGWALPKALQPTDYAPGQTYP